MASGNAGWGDSNRPGAGGGRRGRGQRRRGGEEDLRGRETLAALPLFPAR